MPKSMYFCILSSGKFREMPKSMYMEFIPLAMDTVGGWHKVALEMLANLGRHLARVVGRNEND